ncbi:MAG: glycosyl hydrolase family 8, partial [Clostridiales bacterium]|nr:glycosyl hydrolase family 8 [Clostridiales bacterium]
PRVMPNNRTQAQMNQDVIDQFKKILRDYHIQPAAQTVSGNAGSPTNPDTFRMVIRHGEGGGASAGQITCSESMGYGMLMLTLLAGADEHFIGNSTSNQNLVTVGGRQLYIKDYFDGMFRTVRDFPTNGTSGNPSGASWLHCWEIIQNADGTWSRPSGPSSATDGDMDIIYALMLADKQWGSDGRYNYKQIALNMMESFWQYCVHPTFKTLLLGDWARGSSAGGNTGTGTGAATRPSDFMLDHLKAFAIADPAHDWQAVVDATYGVIRDIREEQAALGRDNGLLSDFVIRQGGTTATGRWATPTGSVLEGSSDQRYAYNSCRIPWRLGTDYMVCGDTAFGNKSLKGYCIEPLDRLVRTLTNNNLGNSTSGQRIGTFNMDGTRNGTGDGGADFKSPFVVTAVAMGDNQAWVDSAWNYSGLTNPGSYNGWNEYLTIHSMIVASGNYWVPFEVKKPLTWPFTPVEWALDKMASIDIDTYGYDQYDDIWLVKRSLGASSYGTMNSPAASIASADRTKFTSASGEYNALYENMLDQEALMIKMWLADLAEPWPGEDWQHHMSRIAQTEYMFTEAPAYYNRVESGRRTSVLGSSTFANNADAKKIMAWQELYEQKFHDDCYVPGKAVQKMIHDMDPANPADVAAARAAYDGLDYLTKSCIMNYQLLTRAEGFVNPDGSDKVQPNIVSVGMRKPTGQDTGFSASNHQSALANLQAAMPDAEPWYIWISGVGGGSLMAGTTSWSVLEASGCLKYPAAYYQQMGISLGTDPVGDAFFAYLDENFPNAQVYLQVENMNRLIEPEMDVLSHRAKQFNCIKGFAVDVEWYNHTAEDCGLIVSDYRAQKWNEDVYSHWGPEYSIALKHYDAHHLPTTYRGGTDGKSNPIILVDDTQNYGSWDGSHGGRYNESEVGDGMVPANGNDWAMFAEYFYPNPVIFQTGYQHDQQWMYSFEDPFMRSYANKCAEVVAPDQKVGIAWVNFNRNGFPEFPNANWRTASQYLSELSSRTIAYLSNYNGDSNNLLGGNWGYYSNAAGQRRLPTNAPTYYDALWVKHVRDYYNTLVGMGAPASNFTGHTNYPRFLAIEPKACNMLIAALPVPKDMKAPRDKGRIHEIYDMYMGLTDAQKAEVTLADDLLAAKTRIDAMDVSVLAYLSVDEESDIDKNVDFTLTIANAKNLLTFEADIVIDGSLLASIGVEPLNGFTVMNDIMWRSLGGDLWSGNVTLAYKSGDGDGFSSYLPVDIATFVFAPRAVGDAAVVLSKIKASGLVGDVTEYFDTMIEEGVAVTNIDQRVFSKYDLNRDGIVDALDLGIMLLYCGFDKDSPSWDTLVKVNDSRGKGVTASMCDVNSDGVIDMLDLLDLFIHYTK